MIRQLRRRHRWLVGTVAVIAAPLYLAALAARPEPAVQAALPAGLAERAASGGGEAVELPTSPPIRVRPVAGSAIELTADGFVEGADLLLYWAPAKAAQTMADAHLLGAVRGGERQILELPAAAVAPGVLFLYSLGHGAEVAQAPWPAGSETRP
jgi:hypothetical protein